jgi:hypothetical protein
MARVRIAGIVRVCAIAISGAVFGCGIEAAGVVFGSAAALAQDRKPAPSGASQGRRTVVGFTETVRLFPGDIEIRAKIDTGARTSSLHAEDIISFERNGRLWVKFHITNRDNRTQTYERPVVRQVKIKSLTGPPLSRPVVVLGICVGDVFRVTEVNLSNRLGFNFQLLIGRRFMRQALVVDPGRQFTREPRCDITDEEMRALDAVPGLPAPKEND